MSDRRILIIEDEDHIAEGLRLNLALQGYAVSVAADGLAGLAQWREWGPDLIVLDIMLPGMDGLTVLQTIRLEDQRLPILILSARGAPEDKIKGLSFGVDDYMAKPFNLEELLLRVDRLLTRTSWREVDKPSPVAATPGIYVFGANRVNFETGVAVCQQGRVRLTAQELKLLHLFINHANKPLSRSRLLEIGWGYSKGMSTRTVDNFLVRFRKYFEENPKKPVFFKSVRSVGYMFAGTGNWENNGR